MEESHDYLASWKLFSILLKEYDHGPQPEGIEVEGSNADFAQVSRYCQMQNLPD